MTGLFVMVDALARTGLVSLLAGTLTNFSQLSDRGVALGSATVVAFGSNLVNNLPAGLIARTTLVAAHASARITDAVLIGVDLGPNLSITNSLATILWLAAIRREGKTLGFWTFLKLGALVMPSALILALGAVVLRS